MGKEKPLKPKKKRDNTKIQIMFSAILCVMVFILELYLIVNDPTNYIALGIFAFLCVIMLYILITGILQVQYEKELKRQEQYESLFKSEKASYLIIRKSFDDIEERLDRLEESSKIPTDKIIEAQKAIAKVTINRNRENAEAMMNSNDQVIEKLTEFSDMLIRNNDDLLEDQKSIMNHNNHDIVLKQQELITSLKELEISIKDDLHQTINHIQIPSYPQMMGGVGTISTAMPNMSAQVNGFPGQAPVMMESPQMTDAAMGTDADFDLPETPMEQEDSEGSQLEGDFSTIGEFAIDKEASDMEEDSVRDDIADIPIASKIDDMAELPIASEINDIEDIPETVIMPETETIPQTPVVPETESIPQTSVMPEIEIPNEPTVTAEPVPTPEPAPTSAAVQPASSDSNHVMTPDEIAQMIASMDGHTMDPGADNADDEPEPELTPEASAPIEPISIEPIPMEPVMEEPKKEEAAPPMPDLSDPNKMLSPEEIAALIANM